MLKHSTLILLAIILTISSKAIADGVTPAVLSFDLDSCSSYNYNLTNEDYSEFIATIQNTPEITLRAVQGNLFRTNPSQNTHSCTPGVDNSEGMCVSYDEGCTYAAESERAVRFDLEVSANGSIPAQIQSFEFFEKSPVMFDWIDGASGINDFPTRYAIRILRDGVPVFEQIDITTNREWALEQFDFSSDDNFLVEETAVFSFYLQAYCPIGNGANIRVWDLDELSVIVECAETCSAEGGTLTGGPFEFCTGNGVADNIPAGAVTLTGNSGVSSAWVVTDGTGTTILGLPPTPEAVNFDDAGAGTCLLWHLSYDGTLDGAMMNAPVAGLTGCFSLSNPITVIRTQSEGGTLTGGPFEFCVGDGVADNIPAGSITLTGNTGTNSAWVVTDGTGTTILGLPPTPEAVDFDGAGLGSCLVWHLSYEGVLGGAVMNAPVAGLTGCFNLSNPITVNRINCNTPLNGGTITGGPFEFCVGDGVADNIPAGSITLTGNTGTNSQWVVTDDQGMILGLPPMPSVVDFDGAGAGVCLIWHLSHEDDLTGAVVGNNAMTDLNGTFDLSNSIAVTRNQPQGGSLTGGPFEFCVGDGVADNIPAGSITLAGNTGTNSQWVVTDDQGNILGLPPTFSAPDFDGAPIGTCLIWHLSYEDGLIGAEMGMNANNLQGCFSLSNPISVFRNDCSVSGGIVINEINSNEQVELKNTGTTSIDISNYWLCNFPAYDRIGTLTIQCGGDLILDPGELVTVITNFTISESDGEMGLYTTNAYTNPVALIDYVEWGTSGHQRSTIAVQAGIWMTGDFVPAFSSTMSIEYDGIGDASTDWSEDLESPCGDNLLVTPTEKETLQLRLFPNPVTNEIRLLSEQESIYDGEFKITLYDTYGRTVYTATEDKVSIKNKRIDISFLDPGNYVLRVLGGGSRLTKQILKL